MINNEPKFKKICQLISGFELTEAEKVWPLSSYHTMIEFYEDMIRLNPCWTTIEESRGHINVYESRLKYWTTATEAYDEKKEAEFILKYGEACKNSCRKKRGRR